MVLPLRAAGAAGCNAPAHTVCRCFAGSFFLAASTALLFSLPAAMQCCESQPLFQTATAAAERAAAATGIAAAATPCPAARRRGSLRSRRRERLLSGPHAVLTWKNEARGWTGDRCSARTCPKGNVRHADSSSGVSPRR
ncbi:hypothetical protein MTO96_002101 [Rhipicephalus appendiculatus]